MDLVPFGVVLHRVRVRYKMKNDAESAWSQIAKTLEVQRFVSEKPISIELRCVWVSGSTQTSSKAKLGSHLTAAQTNRADAGEFLSGIDRKAVRGRMHPCRHQEV